MWMLCSFSRGELDEVLISCNVAAAAGTAIITTEKPEQLTLSKLADLRAEPSILCVLLSKADPDQLLTHWSLHNKKKKKTPVTSAECYRYGATPTFRNFYVGGWAFFDGNVCNKREQQFSKFFCYSFVQLMCESGSYLSKTNWTNLPQIWNASFWHLRSLRRHQLCCVANANAS